MATTDAAAERGSILVSMAFCTKGQEKIARQVYPISPDQAWARLPAVGEW